MIYQVEHCIVIHMKKVNYNDTLKNIFYFYNFFRDDNNATRILSTLPILFENGKQTKSELAEMIALEAKHVT